MTEFEKYAIRVMLLAGISHEYIESQKYNRFLTTEMLNFYDEIKGSEIQCTNIPVNKIKAIGTGWESAGNSVYNLFMGKGEASVHRGRISKNLESLKNYGRDWQAKFYTGRTQMEGIDKIYFCYLKEDDYYIATEGTHRVISAKMFNVPFMSGIVITYKLNHEKSDLYYEHLNLANCLISKKITGEEIELVYKGNNSQSGYHLYEIINKATLGCIAKIRFPDPGNFDRDILVQRKKNEEVKRQIINLNEYWNFFSSFSYKRIKKPLIRKKLVKLIKSNSELSQVFIRLLTDEKFTNLVINLDNPVVLDYEEKEKIKNHIKNFCYNQRLKIKS